MHFCLLLIFVTKSTDFCYKINFFKIFFQEYHQSVKKFVSRLGPTFRLSYSVSKLFAKISADDTSGQRVKTVRS